MLLDLISEMSSDSLTYNNRRERIFNKVMERVHMVDTGHKDNRGNVSHCWLWDGPHSGDGRGGGYPRVSLDGHTAAVHIVMWTNEFGFIPGRKQLDHLCRERMCVRPSHMEMVTHKENQRRRDAAKQEKSNGD